jgi:S-adenosylmethionine:tRNA ribosyltransferase-isomerase
MDISLFDYELPRELIAADPPERRGDSRLMVLHRDTQRIEHVMFGDLPRFLSRGDHLVINDSRVLHARLRGQRVPTGGGVELLLLERTPNADANAGERWLAMARPGRKMTPGTVIAFPPSNITATVVEKRVDGICDLAFSTDNLTAHLDALGEVPLPPYIVQRRKELGRDATTDSDYERYQTVYAQHDGSVAAPTAGLHFTQEHLDTLASMGVGRSAVTLHVGAGTFRPVETDTLEAHDMHAEWYSVADATAQVLRAVRENGGRIVVVGTTTARALESAAIGCAAPDLVRAGAESTRLMIAPGHNFRAVDALITNFHLPRSTLLALVSALAGHEFLMRAYTEAVAQRYRFYSYGDAMLIL